MIVPVCVHVRKYIRVLLVGHTDTHLRLSDWRLVTDSDDVMLVCLNNLQDHFVRHMFAYRAYWMVEVFSVRILHS